MTKSNIIIGKEKSQIDKKKLIKLSVKRSTKDGSKDLTVPGSITTYSTSLGSGTHEFNDDEVLNRPVIISKEYSQINENISEEEKSSDERLSGFDKDLPIYNHDLNFSMASKNKRYLKNQNAWEDDDRKFDDELEQKHTALMFEDLFFHQKMSRHDDKTKSRTEFEIYSKKKTVCFDEEEIDL